MNLNRVFIFLILIISFVWLVVPFTMAVLWSLVDPSEPWTADKIFPPVMSFYRWNYMWENSNLKEALLVTGGSKQNSKIQKKIFFPLIDSMDSLGFKKINS